MIKYQAYLTLALVLAGCNRTPNLEELESRFTRTYLGADAGIQLHPDHVFTAFRNIPGPLTGSPIQERCSGAWEIKARADTFYLVLSQGELVDMSDGICSDSFEIWNPGSGYFSGADTVCIVHPITGELLCTPIDPQKP